MVWHTLSHLCNNRTRSNRRKGAMRFLRVETLEDRRLLAVTDLRVVTYNALNFGSGGASRQGDFQTVFADLSPDIVLMQEITSAAGADLLLGALNAGGQQFSRANFVNGNDTDHMMFYRTSTVDLIGQNYIPTTLREFGEYTVSVDGTQFNLYSAHLKASTGTTNEQRRLDEVTVLRSHLETLPVGSEFIVAGDMNIYDSAEPAYQKFVASEANNDGQLEDLLPPSLIGDWHDNPTFQSIHSQSPRTTSFGGGATGGMDDRFDMILTNVGLNDGTGLEYVADSYFVHGNDGNHFNQSILAGTNNSASPAVIQALHDASDHLPVVADFQIVTGAGLAGVTITESGGSTDVAEGGTSDSYQVVLDTAPTSDVFVDVVPDGQVDLGNGPGNTVSLMFTPSSALIPQTVTVNAVDDSIDEGLHTSLIQHSIVSADADYNGLVAADVLANITDNDAPTGGGDFVINEIYVNPPSGDDNREFIEIKGDAGSLLSDLWLLEIEGDGNNAGTIDAAQNLGSLTLGTNGLVLLGQNYTTSTPWGGVIEPGTTLANLTGGSIENGTISFLLVDGFTGATGNDIDSNNDGTIDNAPWTSIVDSVAWSDGGSTDREYGGVVLAQSGTPDAASRFPGNSTTSSAAAWYNGDITGSGTTRTYSTTSNSGNLPNSAEITPGATNIGIAPPTPGITLTQSGGSTNVAEGGTSDSYTLVLDSIPSADVQIVVAADDQVDLGAGAGVPITLMFTPSNALVPQTVNVTADDDLAAEGAHSSLLSHTVSSTDSGYNQFSVPNVSVGITDNDNAGVPIVESAGSTNVAEGGTTDSYTVRLESVPSSNVTVLVTPDAQIDLGAGAGVAVSLGFTPTNALTPQTVLVTAVDDTAVEGNHTGLITHSVTSADAFYNGISVASVTAAIQDNDATNQPPTASAGANQSLSDADGTGNEPITLSGSGTDSDGTIVGFEWREGATLLGTSATLNLNAAVGSHTYTLTVTDNDGATASDSVVVTVLANQAPTANAGIDLTVADNDGNGSEVVTLNGSGADADGSVVSYQWREGATVLGTTASISPTLSVGVHTLTLDVTDNGGATASDTVVVTVDPATSSGPNLRHGVVANVGSAWTTVALDHSYAEMVVIATPNYDNGTAPAVTRIRNASGNSFEVRVDAAGGATPQSVNVHYIVVEAGAYDQAGFKLEAVTFNSTVTDNNSSWVAETRSYQQAYTNPVVLGQVMSYNDANWSTFWTAGSSRGSIPTSSVLRVGKHVGEDANRVRASETIGYLVIEASTSGTSQIEGLPYVAAVGADTIRGVGNSPGYNYSYSAMPNSKTAIATQAGMDGNNGGWAVLYGNAPITPMGSTISLAVDEDQARDSERRHTTEQVGYFIIDPPTASVGTSTQIPFASGLAPHSVVEAATSRAEAVALIFSSEGEPSPGTVSEDSQFVPLSPVLTVTSAHMIATKTLDTRERASTPLEAIFEEIGEYGSNL